MNPRKILLGLALVVVMSLVLWQINRRPPAITRSAPPVVATVPSPAAKEPVVAPPAAGQATPAPEPAANAELAATARMYAAHAPLRTPEVANPDSQANKQILGAMVAKALAQPPSPPPAASK